MLDPTATPRDRVNLSLTDTVTAVTCSVSRCAITGSGISRYNQQGRGYLTSRVSYDWKKDEANKLLANVAALSDAVNRINEKFSRNSNSLTAAINSLNKSG